MAGYRYSSIVFAGSVGGCTPVIGAYALGIWPISLDLQLDLLAATFQFSLGFSPFAWLAARDQRHRFVREREAARQERLRRLRYCQRCNYDLTGNVSGICPECGTRAAPARAGKP